MATFEVRVLPDQSLAREIEVRKRGAEFSEREERRTDVVNESGEGRRLGSDGPSGASGVGFTDQHPMSTAGQHARRHQAVGAGSDHDVVWGGSAHRR